MPLIFVQSYAQGLAGNTGTQYMETLTLPASGTSTVEFPKSLWGTAQLNVDYPLFVYSVSAVNAPSGTITSLVASLTTALGWATNNPYPNTSFRHDTAAKTIYVKFNT